MKSNKCKLCGWMGRTHIHHIIPRSLDGAEEDENKIELCPNHHAEATEDETGFALKYNLKGKKKSQEELLALQEFSHLTFELGNSEFYNYFPKFMRFLELGKKHGFDNADAISYLMGISKTQAESYENFAIKVFKDKQTKQEDRGELKAEVNLLS